MASFLDLENLQQIYNVNPDSILFAHYAASLIDQGDLEQAIEICQKGLENHPRYAFGRFILAMAHYYQRNYAEAKRELEIALAYDPNIPRGWLLLGNINQSLNLPLMTKESYLRAYLSDPFNQEVAQKVFREEVKLMETPGEVDKPEEEKMPEEPEEKVEEEAVSEFVSDDIDELLGTSEISEKEPGEFEKTLDEVFKETMGEFASEELSEESEKTSEQPVGEQESEKKEEQPVEEGTEEKEIIDDVELSSAMNSFFSEYEKEKTEGEEAKAEESAGKEKETKEAPSEPEFPEEFVDEGPIDFSEVVADLISEREETAGGEETENAEPGITIADETTEPETEEKIVPEPAPEPATPPPAEEPGKPEESSQPAEGEEGATRFGRPPILSPTLGEIYISQ